MFTRLAGALIALLLTLISVAPVAAQIAPDVLVVGGTPAGVAAAVAAARRGANVTLVARRPVLGGVLTDAMMNQWDLNLAGDGASVQGGLFDEIETMLGDSFTPADAARVFGDLVAREPRIRVVTDAQPIAATTGRVGGESHVTAVTFADTRDRRTFVLTAPEVVDATDDGDVAALAGATYDVGRQDTGIDERMQAVTLMFTLDDVDWTTVARGYHAAAYGPGGALDRRAWGYANFMERYHSLAPDVLVRDLNLGHEDGDAVTVNAIDVVGVDGLVPADLQRARALAEAEAPHLVAFLRANLPGFERARIGRFADALYVRETRHFAGLERLTAGDIWDGKIPADTIGLSSYPLDLHPLTPTDRAAFAPTRHVYGVPFGTMIPRGFANLILASPAISASHIASGSARIIPTTIEEGEAAGAAVALAARDHRSFADIAASPSALLALRDDLRAHGAILTPPRDVDVALRRGRG
jgi:hypothetical protein